jgi:hypothetical protein
MLKPQIPFRTLLFFTFLFTAGSVFAQLKDETGSYFFAERNETVIVEAGRGGSTLTDPGLRLRFSNGTVALRKVGDRRYRFVSNGYPAFVTFRADSDNSEETEIYLETHEGNYVLKRVKPAGAETVGKHAGKAAAKDTDPPQIVITSPQLDRGVKIGTQSSKIAVAGRATDESGVNEVLVQDSSARLDEQGNFSADVLLKVGENKITVTAVDIHGNRASKDFTLRRESQSAAATPAAENATTSAVESATPSPSSGRYYALVIGINDYQSLPHLKTAEGDAQAVASVLRERLGFDVSLLLNATRQQIVAALSAYRRELDANASLLIYYAGHGYNDRDADKAYWLPVDATLEDVSNWIIADEITTGIRVIPARHVLVVSDSCYSGTLTRGLNVGPARSSEREQFLQKMSAGRSRTLMASGGDEPVADGGGSGHSVFAAALLRGLREMDKPRFTASELFAAYVIEPVAGRSDQTPIYNPLRNSGHESGDFVFMRKK